MSDPAPSNHWFSGKRVVVAGAGISGLAFAIAFNKQWLSVRPNEAAPPPELVVFERDSAEDAIGREGYSMSLRSDPPGGLQALRSLGILEQMLDASITKVPEDGAEMGGFCLWEGNWKSVIKVKARAPDGLPVGGMRIARKNLRGVLVKAAEEQGVKVTWGIGCVSVSRGAEGQLRLQLSNGSEKCCDVLIAADGASSKLRRQLRPDDTLHFQHVNVLGGTARFGTSTPPAPLNRDWGILATGHRVALFASPVDDHSALWSLSWDSSAELETKKSPMSGPDAATALALARKLASTTPNLPANLHDLIDRTDRDTLMAFNAKDKMPFAHPANQAYRDVVFIGDANHAVSPFAGNGANTALCDGWDLAAEMGRAASLEQALERYDAVAVPRSARVVKMSRFNAGVAHAPRWKLWFYYLLIRVVKLFFRKYVE